MLTQPDARLALTPTQQELFKAIADKRTDMASCYHAGIAILNDEILPDRFPLAAHSFRELIEKLPSEGTTIDQGAALAEDVKALRSPWAEALAEDLAHGGEQRWCHGVGESLRDFLLRATNFFTRREAVSGTRREQTIKFLNGLDVGAVALPQDVQSKNAEQWLKLRGYFTDVSHHRFPAAEAEFRERVTQLEMFLHSRLIPRPTADFAAIDALLREE